jgi:hypothetical protein
MEVGRQGSIVLFGGEDKFGESLDRVRWVFGEEGIESADYESEEGFGLRGKRTRRAVVWWRRILLVCGLGRCGAVLAGALRSLRLGRRGA